VQYTKEKTGCLGHLSYGYASTGMTGKAKIGWHTATGTRTPTPTVMLLGIQRDIKNSI